MELTFIGAGQVLIGLSLFMAGTVEAMFGFMLISAMFGGSAAIALPALGGSSIPPVQFALVFMAMRLLVPGGGQMAALGRASGANLWLIAFVAYGAVLAFIAPHIFAGQIEVTPLRGRTEARYISTRAYIYATKPLASSTQNVTTAIYLCGTLLAGLAAHVACQRESGRAMLVRTMAAIGIVHALLGFIGIAVKGTPAEAVLLLFRNGSYAQLDHSYRGFVRMTGIWPEASGYANFAIVWFVFVFECWLRRIDTRWTGAAAVMLAAALAFSTSSTAYVGLPVYGLMLAVRSLLFPGALRADRVLWIAGGALVFIAIACGVMLWHPVFAADFGDLIRHMTVDKTDSLSGTQRRFWAWQGIEAFVHSGGIGIGPGSFRSSSLATAVLGSTGVIGTVALVAHIVRAFMPLRFSTYGATDDPALATGAAAAWAMLIGVLVASIALPSCDPGTDFAILAGASLALRARLPQIAAVRPPTAWAKASELQPQVA